MGLLELMRLMSMQRQRQRRRRQAQGRDESIPSLAKRDFSSRQQDADSGCGKRVKYSGTDLPEDIWRHIHSLLPMKDSARAACVSRTFLRCWRCHPNLAFSNSMLGLNEDEGAMDNITSEFTSKVDQVLKNHCGIGLKTLKLEFSGHSSSDCYFLNSWLQVAVTSDIEELSLMLCADEAIFNFPCSLLSDQSGSSIRYLYLAGCAFRPTVRLSCLKNLTKLQLYCVGIKGIQFGCLLSSCSALEQLELGNCHELAGLKIPCTLQRLNNLKVSCCSVLREIESKAPNMSSFHFGGRRLVELSLGEQVKDLSMSQPCALYDACATLPSIVPNLETLTIKSGLEVNNPMMHSQFLYLKYLRISVASCSTYDYISLVSFLDASPSLETFILEASMRRMEHDSIFGDSSHLRRMPGHHHDKLKSLKIIGFNSAKSLIELTVHIIENAGSLESLTLDTTYTVSRCCDNKIGECYPKREFIFMEAPKSLLAIRTYIQEKIPSTVKLNVLEPCNLCHAFEH